MKFVGEYIIYLVATILAIVIFVKPITREHWPFLAKVIFYLMSGVLFFGIILFEYFTKTNLTDIVRESLGNAVCNLYPLRACPNAPRQRAEPEQVDQREAPAAKRFELVPQRIEPVPPAATSPPTATAPLARPFSGCNAKSDEEACKMDTTCSWIAALMDAKTGMQKRKAYCKTKPPQKSPGYAN